MLSSCTVQSEENAIGDYSLGLNWGWATKSEEHSLKRDECVCSLILVSSLLSLTEDVGLGQFPCRQGSSEGSLAWDTGVAENSCWARTFTTLAWAKHCLPLSHSFASPISLFLTGGDGCLRHGSTSRSRGCYGCRTGKGTLSHTEQPLHTQNP